MGKSSLEVEETKIGTSAHASAIEETLFKFIDLDKRRYSDPVHSILIFNGLFPPLTVEFLSLAPLLLQLSISKPQITVWANIYSER